LLGPAALQTDDFDFSATGNLNVSQINHNLGVISQFPPSLCETTASQNEIPWFSNNLGASPVIRNNLAQFLTEFRLVDAERVLTNRHSWFVLIKEFTRHSRVLYCP